MRSIEFTSPNEVLTEEALSKVEREIGVSFPESYREFMRTTNGGGVSNKNNYFQASAADKRQDARTGFELDILFPVVVRNNLKGLDIKSMWETFLDRVPDDTIPVGLDPLGNVFLLGIRAPVWGRVFFWDHEFEAAEGEANSYHDVINLSDSFDEFIDHLVENPPPPDDYPYEQIRIIFPE